MTNGSSEQQTEATIANVDAQGRVANRADRSADQPAAPLGTASSGSMPLTVAMPPSGSAFAVALPEDRPLIVENADLEEVTRTEAGGDTILTFADGGTIVLTGVTGVTLARGELGGRAAIIVLEDEAAEVEPEAGEKADHGGGADFAALSIDDLGATPGVTGAGAASDAGGLGGGASDARGLSGALSGNAAGDGASNGNGSGSGGASGPNTNTLMPNYAPVANDDVARGDEDHLLRFNRLANDPDPNNNEHLSVVAVDAPGLQGRLSFDAEGNVVFDPRGVFDHLQQGEEAVQTFRYTVQDRHGATDEAVGTLIIEGRNDRPVASDDNIHLDEDTPLTFKSKWLSADDFDVDGDTLRVSSVGKAEHGRVVLNPDGTITFTPDANFNGEASFHYTVSDGHGGFDTGRVAVHVAAVNDRPDPTEDNVRTVEDQAITFPAGWLSGDDFDVEGDTLRVESVHHAENGTVVLHKNGTITFTPDADFNGVASFRYTVTDGNGGHSAERVNVHVAPVNDAPVASDDTVSTDEDTALTFASSQLAADDLDVDGDALTVTEVRNATNGTVTLDADGTILFTPDANFAGIAGFDYTVSDGQGGFDTAHVTVQVRPVNDAPVAASDAFFGMEDTALVLQPEDLLANDADLDGDALTITRVFDAVNGTATLMPDGTIVVTPDANFDGVVRFEYAIADPSGETSEAFGYVVATSVNDAPTRIRITIQ